MSQAVMHEHIPVTAAGFRQRGFGRFDNLIDEDELAYLRDVYDQLFADPASQPGFKNLGGEDAAGNYLMPQIGGASNIHPELHELQYFKRLRDLAKDLLGDKAAFRNDHMIFKPAGTPRDTPWHQDQAYHSPNLRYKNVNFWLPLDGASIEEGCLWFVPYTHGGTVVIKSGDSTGAIFHSETHVINIDRDYLLIKRNSSPNAAQIEVQEETKGFHLNGKVYSIEKLSGDVDITPDTSEAYLDLNKLQFPLTIRQWEAGDKFVPLGMKGSKKVSDFLVDQKVPLIEKDNVSVMISNDEIVWLIGYRIDDRFKIDKSSKEILKVAPI